MTRDLSKEQKKLVKLFKECTAKYDILVKNHQEYVKELEVTPPGPKYDELNEKRKINETKARKTNDEMVFYLNEINKLET